MTSVIRIFESVPLYHFDFSDLQPIGHEVVEATTATQLSEEGKRQRVQTELKALRIAAEWLHESEAPHVMQSRDAINERFHLDTLSSDADRPEFCRTRKVVSWLARASYKDLHTFCVWNDQRAAQLQERIDQDTPELRHQSEWRARRLIGTGVLPAHALHAYQRAHEQAPRIRTFDSFTAGAQRVDGIMKSDGTVALANLYALRSELYDIGYDMISTMFHEDTHASGKFTQSGFMPDSMLEEFIVSHLTAVSGDRQTQPDVFDPHARHALDKGHYIELRELLSLAIAHGPHDISASDLGEAFYDRRRNQTAKTGLKAKLDDNVRQVIPGFERSGLTGLSSVYERISWSPEYMTYMAGLIRQTRERTGTSREVAINA